MLDHCMYPQPHDVFADVPRSEIYGLHDDQVAGGPLLNPSTPMTEPVNAASLAETYTRHAHAFFRTRNIPAVDQCLQSLRPSERRSFLAAFISAAMSSGDESDAAAVASLLSTPSIRRAMAGNLRSGEMFEAEVALLEDTVLDYPCAYDAMASMLHAAGIPIPLVEDLASRIVIRENPARDRLLEEFSRINVSGDDGSDRYEIGAEDASGEESASEYAYAY